ncbi:hypothetical protein SAMN06295905_1921 [Devosia lucknowensis]|uniref:SMODS and SLOG-associating 2TM effector domain-containing protein n=1 Tax=Devosia lucknowensis TaxID=1096929 RepID=A0A1Y6FEW3_9HYPH|nr:SLATT domain-containing protein [Devosia lucknowensis]SMQ70943.1 hypothetical protein SAMN06295905_1921 [Devosia lucknowensis]
METTLGKGLSERLWRTKGTRFVAMERHKTTNVVSITTIALLSVYVICTSLVQVAFASQLSDDAGTWLNVVNIALSILVIVFSLIEWARDHVGSAQIMNDSGLKLGEIYGALFAKIEAGTLTPSELETFEAKYASALRESRLNHHDGDYLLFKLDRWREFRSDHEWMENALARWGIGNWVRLKSYGLYILAIAFYPMLAVLTWQHLWRLPAG